MVDINTLQNIKLQLKTIETQSNSINIPIIQIYFPINNK